MIKLIYNLGIDGEEESKIVTVIKRPRYGES